MLNRKFIILTIGVFLVSVIIEAARTNKESTEISDRVLSTFNAIDLDNITVTEYNIEILSAGRYRDAVKLLAQNMYTDRDAKYRYYYEYKWMSLLNEGISVGCFEKRKSDLIGVNVLFIDEKLPDSDLSSDDKCGNLSVSFLGSPINSSFFQHSLKKELDYEVARVLNFNVFEEYNVDRYLASDGFVVDPKYQKRGIGEKLLRSRERICRRFGLNVTSTIFTTWASSRSAEKAGFEIDRIARFEDILAKYPEVDQSLAPINPFVRKSKTYR